MQTLPHAQLVGGEFSATVWPSVAITCVSWRDAPCSGGLAGPVQTLHRTVSGEAEGHLHALFSWTGRLGTWGGLSFVPFQRVDQSR